MTSRSRLSSLEGSVAVRRNPVRTENILTVFAAGMKSTESE